MNFEILNTVKESIDNLVKTFFALFTNKLQKPKLELIKLICVENTFISRNSKNNTDIFNLETFITPRIELLTNGSLINFEEKEISESTVIKENIAQRVSLYQKEGILNGERFSETGNKLFQFLKIDNTWKICSIIWNDNK